VAGEVLQPQLAHNLCRLIAEQDSELHSTAVKMFLSILDHGTTAAAAPASGAAPTIAAGSNGASSSSSGVLPEILLNSICWVLGEYGSLAADLPRPWQASPQQVGRQE
jgi:AP-4 complex subunit epsilon-1